MCEESASFDWKSSDIAAAIRDLDSVSEKISQLVAAEESSGDIGGDSEAVIAEDFNLQDVYNLKMILAAIETKLDEFPLPKPEGISKPGETLFELFSDARLTFDNKNYLSDVLDKMVTYLAGESQSTFQSKGNGLSKFNDVIKIAFSRDVQVGSNSNQQRDLSKAYKVHICEEKKNTWGKKKKTGWDAAPADNKAKQGRVLSYWCFSPGHAMEDLRAQGVRSIILTSGTLSPMESFTTEMGIPFPIQLENPHVIDPHQIWIGVIGKGPDGTMLSSSYENRFKPVYQSSLGNAIVNFARVVPHGLLLFFPSYPVMDKSLEHWQEHNMWNRIEQYKPIFIEPKGKQDFLFAMENFYEKINDSSANGACFAAVCRGKVSEGLDFADNNGRAVVITGLPFPPRMDPKVVLKMQYLDEQRSKGKKGLSGQAWYRQQASRAVNQAIGRVIRHRQDYGAIILCDTRFSSSDSVSQLPSWVRPGLKVYSNFGSAIKDMMVFFKSAEKNLPTPTGNKKSKSKGEPGCQGAFFEPTVSRSANSRIKVDKLPRSCDIDSHVPSLQQQYAASTEIPLAKLKMQYEHSAKLPTQSKPKGLFEALHTNDKEHIGFFGASPELTATQSRITPSANSTQVRKKILLKKDTNRGEINKDSIQTAEQYLVEVKKTLSAESYQFFSKTLTTYKKNGDYTTMITCLADIFTDNAMNYHLFKKFYKFVRSHHKEEFDRSCRELTGEGCGYRAKDASKKRALSGTDQDQDNSEKKLKSVSGSGMCTKDTPKCDSLFSSESASTKPPQSNLDSKTHMNTKCLTSQNQAFKKPHDKPVTDFGDGIVRQKENRNSAGSESLFGKNDTGALSSRLTDNTKKERDTGKNSKLASTTKKESGEKNGSITNRDLNTEGAKMKGNCGKKPTATRSIVDTACTNVLPNPCTVSTAEAYDNAEKFIMESLPPTGYVCCHCSKDATIPLKALCEHVCCMECWKICIGDTKQCPQCKEKVKRKHLQRICFPTQTN